MQQASQHLSFGALTITSGLMRHLLQVGFHREGRFGRAAEPQRCVGSRTFQEPGRPGRHRENTVGQMSVGVTFEPKAKMMTRTIKIFHLAVLTAAAALLLVTTTDVAAQGRNCGPREAVGTRLAEGYGETRQSMGLGSNNAVIEVFASDETGSWTITVTQPNGLTCLVASGQGYEQLAEALPAKGEDA